MTDRTEMIQRLFRLEVMITTWGIQDSAQMISIVFIGTKVFPSKRDLCWFSISGYTRPSKICSWTKSQVYVMRYKKVCLHCYSSFQNDKCYNFIIFYCSDTTANLKSKKLSTKEVEDWKVTFQVMTSSPSFHSYLMRCIGKHIGQL